jgi:hypothetical protein
MLVVLSIHMLWLLAVSLMRVAAWLAQLTLSPARKPPEVKSGQPAKRLARSGHDGAE